ncbi:glycosyl transferase [Sphingobium bisphenolivorans]|uniref:glycosyl transferase n=1 Tax=Sphingobium bisphenolivorans TaxID=1335760 RepID=UPI00039DDFE2|nr:glycosyl transferase [Sphingobium bisphenolivorans]
MKGPVAFLFLGETLLIPHLYPIVEALAGLSDVPIDLWASTSVHEELLARWTAELDRPTIRIRRAPGFRRVQGGGDGRNPALPAKLPMLFRLLPHLIRAPIAVCAEQTSLWLPTLLPLPTRFVKTSHGVGSMSARDDRRRRAPRLTLVPSERERQTYLDRGFAPDRIFATGYVKASFRQRTYRRPPFRQERPTILFTPHWQPHRSSWPQWGRQIVEQLAEQSDYNVIIAPHQRLVEKAPELREVMAKVANLPHVHCDLDSFAMVDGSYTEAADIYLGDTSSQVLEYLMRPRPCLFLNAHGIAWRDDPSYAQWKCGEVVDRLEDVLPALARAPSEHPHYAPVQQAFASSSLGDTGPDVPARVARHILTLLEQSA